jgi:anti-sigma B factor antagonist
MEAKGDATDGKPVIISVEGEFDNYSSRFKAEVFEFINNGARKIVVDLTKVEYLDSTALGWLIGSLKRLRELDGDLALICPPSPIRRVFEANTGLYKIFDIFNTTEEALAFFKLKEPTTSATA